MFTKLNHLKIIKAKPLISFKKSLSDEFSVFDRQKRIEGFNQEALINSTGILIGAGGIGGEIGEGLVRKGIGCLKLFDHDTIDITNLNRQFFFKKDINKNKATQLAVNLSQHATYGTKLIGHPLSFEDSLALNLDLNADFVICGVDNAQTRIEVSKYYRDSTPVIFIAVDLQAECGYVFVQEPKKACFGCKFPRTLGGGKTPCFTPAVKDILKVMAGTALYAIDSLIMDRKRNWNYREFHLAGYMPDVAINIEKISHCPLCGG